MQLINLGVLALAFAGLILFFVKGREPKDVEHAPCWEVLQLCHGDKCKIDEAQCQLHNHCNLNVYNLNVYHQLAEFVFPTIDMGITRQNQSAPPEIIWWRFDLLPVSREVLQLAFPNTTTVTGYYVERMLVSARYSPAAIGHIRSEEVSSRVSRIWRAWDAKPLRRGVSALRLKPCPRTRPQ
jgi:hypothetical protein